MSMDMPPITQDHLQTAFMRVALKGWTFDAAMSDPVRRHVIVACAHAIRTREWERTQRRSVEAVRRVRLGLDGHPIGWCTQLAQSQLVPVSQPELI